MKTLAAALALLAAAPAWRVEVASHGGASGRGAGAVKISSSGDAEVVTPSGQRCRVRLARSELERLERAVRSAQPGRWRPRYFLPDNPTGCCDQTATTLALLRGPRAELRSVTGWFDESRQLVPADALALHDAAMDAAAAHQGCPAR
ncbi:MAG TPA: hypothetical protein VM683_02045 [Anaeromyxobacteraceae bacterium]|nr:hypothetical protein [Anaeromyxobacteraceae bacterium]